jgi:leucyl-tRNA synthetase
VWRNVVDEVTGALVVVDEPASEELRRLLHRTVDGVRRDMANLRFNTAVAKLIELNNALTREPHASREVVEPWCSCSPRSRRTSPRSCGRDWVTTSR